MCERGGAVLSRGGADSKGVRPLTLAPSTLPFSSRRFRIRTRSTDDVHAHQQGKVTEITRRRTSSWIRPHSSWPRFVVLRPPHSSTTALLCFAHHPHPSTTTYTHSTTHASTQNLFWTDRPSTVRHPPTTHPAAHTPTTHLHHKITGLHHHHQLISSLWLIRRSRSGRGRPQLFELLSQPQV